MKAKRKVESEKIREAASWIFAVIVVLVAITVFILVVFLTFDWFVKNVIGINLMHLCSQYGLPAEIIMILLPVILVALLLAVFGIAFRCCIDIC